MKNAVLPGSNNSGQTAEKARAVPGAAGEPCDVCGQTAGMTPVVTVSLSGAFDAEIQNCGSCGFRQIRPRIMEQELPLLYPDAYFDSDSAVGFGDYARQQQRCEREAYFIARELRGVLDGGRVLEVGCALGFFLDALRRFSKARVEGIDVSAFAAEFARRKFGLEVRATTLEAARFEEASFDLVVQTDLLEHVLRPREHLEETRRVLRPGGLTWLITPNGETNVRPLAKRAAEEAAAGSGMMPMIDQGHLSFFTRGNLERLFHDTGFEVVRMRSIHLQRGLRALGWLPRKRRKEKVAPGSRIRRERLHPPAPSAEPVPPDASMERLYAKLCAEMDGNRRKLRANPAYFHFRHAMKRLASLPSWCAFGLDFDCLLRKR